MTPPSRSATRGLVAAALLLPGVCLAQKAGPEISDAEALDPPTQARLRQVEDAAASAGWASVEVPLRTAALRAFQQDRFIAADAWFHAFEWSALFSEPESQFASRWVQAMQASHLDYPAVAGEYHPTDKPLGSSISQPMQAWLIENPQFSEEFFSNLNQLDYLPKVFGILEGLHRRDPGKFAKYSSLAIAVALVYDVPPPPYWPHFQVSAEALPRKLPNPAEPFEWLTAQDSLGRTYQKLTRLRPEELKFVVDFAASVPELQWSLQNVRCPLDRFEDAYFMVKYRMDRFNDPSKFTWTGEPYTLQAILAEGGICVDQAYFATQAGKARGVPTLLFAGSGQDGRHAWFGYLDSQGKWRLDAGRYAEQRLVTGAAMDPQTWTQISDHELQFLSERFRALPSFMQSRVHEEFARDFLGVGNAALAAKAAREAVNFERRNLDAWETLAAADARLGLSAAAQEGVLREAALAFSPKYPDLVIYYENRVVRSLRARGERSLADFEEQGIAERLKGDRADLAVMQASAILARSMATQQVDGQIATYNAILSQFGRGAGTIFFDQIVVSFAEHLALLHLKAQARDAVERARDALDVQPGTQISMDVDKLMDRLRD
jgi:hypothetical protein